MRTLLNKLQTAWDGGDHGRILVAASVARRRLPPAWGRLRRNRAMYRSIHARRPLNKTNTFTPETLFWIAKGIINTLIRIHPNTTVLIWFFGSDFSLFFKPNLIARGSAAVDRLPNRSMAQNCPYSSGALAGIICVTG